MRGPSLQKTALISFTLHLTAFLIAFLMFRQTNHMLMPPPMTVSLVSSDIMPETRKENNTAASEEFEKPAAPQPKETTKKNMKEVARQKEMVDKKIAALEALAAKKKIEKIVRLRSTISLKAGSRKQTSNPQIQTTSNTQGTTFDDYYSKITQSIWGQWSPPPNIYKKSLYTTISIRVSKNGYVTNLKVEKSSGNSSFDNIAIRAIKKASPLPPPPYEMEIGVNFTNEKSVQS